MKRIKALAELIAIVVLAACTRKEPAETVAQPHAEDADIPYSVCKALKSDASTVGHRFAGFLPPPGLRVGVLYVFQGDVGKVRHYTDDPTLVNVRQLDCPDNNLVVFIPMIDPRSAARFEKELVELDGGTASISERHFFNGEPEPYSR